MLCLFSFIIGGLLVWFITPMTHPVTDTHTDTSRQVREGETEYTNPLLECDVDQQVSQQKEFASLERDLQEVLDSEKGAGNVTDVSLYYRDLNNGPWFGVRENVHFSPASLLKLPVLMAYYKEAEMDPSVLTEQFEYDATVPELTQVFSDSHLEIGKKYTADELIELMIQKSDNGALNVLTDHIDSAKIDKIFKDLDMAPMPSSDTEDFMSVKDYAALFRVLYNASYLSHEYSEKALAILTQTDFVKGLVAGVPSSVKVAHKYGEREYSTAIRQVHDCGIVYYPRSPYLICVMTRGADAQKQADVIQKVSKTVYTEVSNRFK
jgi:beta-lactamase class A